MSFLVVRLCFVLIEEIKPSSYDLTVSTFTKYQPNMFCQKLHINMHIDVHVHKSISPVERSVRGLPQGRILSIGDCQHNVRISIFIVECVCSIGMFNRVCH